VYGYRHAVYDRFNWGSERGLWAQILLELQKRMAIVTNEVIIDSTAMKARRQGDGQKGGERQKGCPGRE
jgi:hypothetical protein